VASLTLTHLNDPVTQQMHQDFTRLRAGQTVGEALGWLRRNPPTGRIIYFYVVDEDGRLQGVVPTRRLVLSAPEALLSDIMVGKVIAVSSAATVLEACELFIQNRLLAFPVVDEEHRILGVVDIELYTDVLQHLDRATPAGRLVAPLVSFFRIESSGGLVLLAFTAVALVVANSPFAESFRSFWEQSLGIKAGDFELKKSLLHWINHGLMTLFFLVVGLEIKHEVVSGELADPRKALLPVVAAVGGMIVPAALYALCLWGRPGSHGWGVPMATDIAFVVGFLTLLGPRVPQGLKILLLTLAIADDIGAVLVIAVAYSTEISFTALACAAAGLGLIVVLLRFGVRSLPIYAALAAAIWLAFLKSGVHPTLAGIALGLLTPARHLPGRPVLLDVVSDMYARLRGTQPGAPRAAQEALSPVERLEESLHPWVAFAVMPLFALVNAGVKIDPSDLATPVALAVMVGLVVGKPLGIVLFSWVSVRSGVTRLPDGTNWKVMVGAGCLGGIGFTMSLFIAGLALEGDLLTEAKIGILTGSAVSAVLGCALLVAFLPRKAASAAERGG
jgi:NhaA family Na+:H+ antiporter